MTLEQYNEMFERQNRCCAICKGPETSIGSKTNKSPKRMSVDHDHSTNKIRGLLCQLCNMMLGASKDNPDILRSAIDYLEEDPAP